MNSNTLKIDNQRQWHVQQEVLLKDWAEVASCFRWLHDRAHQKFKQQNMWFVLPVIVLSTITGTLSFAHSSFPPNIQPYVPLGIGALNILAGMMSTIAQFLRVSQLMESHRVASLSFEKLSRSIRIELALPWAERSAHGRDFLKTCRSEMDRLMEQSHPIPLPILAMFEKRFEDDIAHDVFLRPEILDIHAVTIYDHSAEQQERKVADIVADAAAKFKKKQAKPQWLTPQLSPQPDIAMNRDKVRRELAEVQAMGSVRQSLRVFNTQQKFFPSSPAVVAKPLEPRKEEIDLAAEAEGEEQKQQEEFIIGSDFVENEY